MPTACSGSGCLAQCPWACPGRGTAVAGRCCGVQPVLGDGNIPMRNEGLFWIAGKSSISKLGDQGLLLGISRVPKGGDWQQS